MFTKGQRVQAHPATDAWIFGDRYGTVIGRTRSHLHDTSVFGIRVRMDSSGKVRTFHPGNLLPVD
jgi:hypothetical protein